MNIVLLGAPGAGKGTQAELIRKALGVPVISTGNLLREEMKKGTEIGRSVKSAMETGLLVPDELIIALVRARTEQTDCQNGVIFDGFPRTINQAAALDDIVPIDIAISIEADDEVIEKRLSGRRICTRCQATYHVTAIPPKVENRCDKCGSALTTRADDELSVVRQRLLVYHNETKLVKGYYEKRGNLRVVVSQKRFSDTTKLVSEALGVPL